MDMNVSKLKSQKGYYLMCFYTLEGLRLAMLGSLNAKSCDYVHWECKGIAYLQL